MYVYILLMRSPTIVSRAVHLLTHAQYTHVAIGTDEVFYTYSRFDPHYILPGGFTKEHSFIKYPHTIKKLEVTWGQWLDLRKLLVDHPHTYKFNILGLILVPTPISYKPKKRYFCSQFCAEMLSKAHIYTFPKPLNKVRPIDFLSIPGLQDCTPEEEKTLTH